MSKIIERFEQSERGVSQPMGFAAGPRAEPVPSILLLGRVGSAAEATTAAEAGLDGALVSGVTQKTEYGRVAKALAERPWGPWVDEGLDVLPASSDFQVFAATTTRLSVLGGEERTNFMEVSLDLDDATLDGLEGLPVEGFVVSLAQASALDIGQLLRLGRVRACTSKWLALEAGAPPSSVEAEQLRSAGVNAIVLAVEGRSADELKAIRKTLLDLPAESPRKRERRTASLPRLGSSRSASEPDEPELPDDDDFDDD